MKVRCEFCGQPFDVKPSRIKRLKLFNSVCCSTDCSGNLKSNIYVGSSNPNFKFDRDLNFIYELSHDGAYILGLIFSDGHIGKNSISIYQDKEKSGFLLENISNRIFNKNLVSYKPNSTMGVLDINDKDLIDFIISLGGINKGKKSDNVSMPAIPEDKKWSFVAGYFDGDGGFKYNYRYPEISISSNSNTILKEISELWKVNYTGKDKIYASGNKALDICGKMYEKVSFRHTKKYEYFMDILNWQPLPHGSWNKDLFFKYKKLSDDAISPTKNRVTDSGYDICAVEITYDKKTDLYKADTKIAIEPIPGWYFDMLGRSSLPKSGFMFVGGVGVIDRSYVGPLIMMLKKIREDAILPELPFKLAQLIPRRIIHADFIEVDTLGETDRGADGFGSTGR
jgi:dUTP pyrophosphatase